MVKNKRKRYFGIVKIPRSTKACWLSKEDKNGWSLGLALNSRTVWLKGLRFSERKEVERILEKLNVVFINLKNHAEEV